MESGRFEKSSWNFSTCSIRGVLCHVKDEFLATVSHELRTPYASTVQSASSAQEGFDLLHQMKPNVLICDIGLPIEDGYQLIERIRRLPESEGGLTPAIDLTAYASPRDRLRALAAGFHTHLSKPVQPEFLVKAVADLTGRT